MPARPRDLNARNAGPPTPSVPGPQRLGEEFPGWQITLDGGTWTAHRATPPYGGTTEFAANDFDLLRELLADMRELDDRHALSTLRHLLRHRGVPTIRAGSMLTVPRPRNVEAVVTCEGGTIRWNGRDVGTVADLDAAAQKIREILDRSR